MAAGRAASTGASPQNRFRAVVLPHDSAIIQVLRALGRFRRTFKGRVGHGKRIPATAYAGCHRDQSAARYDDNSDLQSLRQENARLRQLVVQLSSLVIKTIADQK
jgi:hypothetical protein